LVYFFGFAPLGGERFSLLPTLQAEKRKGKVKKDLTSKGVL
jgi:hypothetical protein